jgi:hypothetical protein
MKQTLKRFISAITTSTIVMSTFTCLPFHSAAAEKWESLPVWDGTSDAAWYAAGSTELHIDTPEELAGLSSLSAMGITFAGQTIYLDGDFCMNGAEDYAEWGSEAPTNKWTPIADFQGTIIGNGSTIYNLYCSEADSKNGFIANLTDASVSGIILENLWMESGPYLIGGITAKAQNSEIFNCRVSGTVGPNGSGGGIVGEAVDCNVYSCSNYADVTGTGAAGIIGKAVGCTVHGCYNRGNITGFNAAGIVCYTAPDNSDSKTDLYCCYNTGTISVTDEKFCQPAGILFSGNAADSISKCYYLEGTAPAGISDEDVSDTTIASTKETLQSQQFAEITTSGYVYIKGDYPVLGWEATTDVWVNGEKFGNGVTTIDCGNGTATYYAAQDTLVLDNATITESVTVEGLSFGIYSASDIHISIIGNNGIGINEGYIPAAVAVYGDLVLDGSPDDTLIITSDMGSGIGFMADNVKVKGGNYIVACKTTVFGKHSETAVFDISEYNGAAAVSTNVDGSGYTLWYGTTSMTNYKYLFMQENKPVNPIITKLKARVTYPIIGMTPADCGSYLNYTDNASINGIVWQYENTATEAWEIMNDDQKFEAGITYNCTIEFIPNDGYTFADSKDEMNGIVNGEEVTLSPVYSSSKAYLEYYTEPLFMGDVNVDGKFSIADVVALQKWLVSAPGATLVEWRAGDMCDNDKLDVFDICVMKRELLKKN